MRRYLSIPTTLFLARRNMRSRRGRTALTLLGIVLGVAVVLSIQITNQTTLDSLRRVFDRTTGQANLLVVPSTENGEAIDDDLLPRLQEAEGLQVAAPSIKGNTLLSSHAESWQIAFSMSGIASGNMLQIYGVDPELDPQVRVYELVEGRMPQLGKNEVVIPQKLAAEEKLRLGQDLEILAPGGSPQDRGGRRRLKIVGLLSDEGVALLNDGNVAFAPLDVVQDIFGRKHELDEIALWVQRSISEDPTKLESLKEKLDRRIGDQGRVIYPAARGQLVSQMLATYQFGLTFFSVIAIFVGAFLIYNTFSMTVAERTREIGMLRAIGTSRFQVLRMVLSEAGLFSLVGSALGLGVGIALARGLIRLMGNLVTAQEGAISIPSQGLLESLGVGIGVTLVAALLPAIQAARITPLEALRARSRASSAIRPVIWISGLVLILVGWVSFFVIHWKEQVLFTVGNLSIMAMFLGATLTVALVMGWLEKLTRPLASWIYGNEGVIGSANVHRSPGRTTLTVASLMVALTMIISISSLAFSFKQDVTSWIENALGGDLYVRAISPVRETYAHQLLSVPGVRAVSPARYLEVKVAPGSLHSDSPETEISIYFAAIDPRSFREIANMEFAANQGSADANWQRFEQGKAVFISTGFADQYGLRQGDDLRLLTHRGEQAFTIAAEVVDFGGSRQAIYGTYSDLHRWFAEQGVDRFTLSVAPGYTVNAVSKEIETRYKDRWHISIQTTEAFKKSILDLTDQSFRLFDVLNLIGVIIGVLGVINTLIMNVIERRREIGGLRSLGMTRGQVLRMVLAEALALGVMGGIYGQVVGLAIAQALIRGLNQMVGYDLVYRFTAQPHLLGAFISLVVVQGAAIYPARRAASVNIVDSIKHE